jgi:hypothetical protein
MDIKLIYYFLLLFSCLGFSKQSKLGQVSLGNYYGPNLALYHFDTKLKKNISHDDYFEKWYFQSKMQSEFFNLNDYFQGEFLTGHYCPDTVFDKHEYYYRYLVRLLSISYLYEAIREYQFTAKQMGHPEICRPVWEKVFSSCRPKTKDMQEFKTNIKHFIKNIKDVIIPYEMSKVAVREKWFVDINQSRIRQNLKSEN